MAEFAVPDAALLRLLNWMIRDDTATVEDLALRLFTNAATPGRNSVTADFTEATFGGYSQRALPRAIYGPAVLDTHTAKMTLAGPALQWLPTTTGQNLRGCFVVGQGSNLLYAARLFATPRETVAGVMLKLFPVWSLATPQVA